MKLNAGSSAIIVERLSAMEFMDGIHFPQNPQCLQCDTQEEKLLNWRHGKPKCSCYLPKLFKVAHELFPGKGGMVRAALKWQTRGGRAHFRSDRAAARHHTRQWKRDPVCHPPAMSEATNSYKWSLLMCTYMLHEFIDKMHCYKGYTVQGTIQFNLTPVFRGWQPVGLKQQLSWTTWKTYLMAGIKGDTRKCWKMYQILTKMVIR